MLPALEKALWGLFFALLTCAGAWLAWFGFPSTTPALAMESVEIAEADLELSREAEDTLLRQRSSGARARKLAEVASPATAPLPPARFLRIDADTLTRFGNLNDCISELNFASSEPLADGSLRIFAIAEGSLLATLGFADGDVLRAVGGATVDFGDVKDCHDRWQENLAHLESGTPVVIEFLRGDQVEQIVLSPPQTD